MGREHQSVEVPFSFEGNGEEVAKNLIGGIIIAISGRFLITQIKYYPSDEITASNYQDAKHSVSGTVTGSPYRNAVLTNISVSENDLVMPIKMVEFSDDGQVNLIQGAGMVSKALGIDKNKKYKLEISDPYSKIFYLTTTMPEE